MKERHLSGGTTVFQEIHQAECHSCRTEMRIPVRGKGTGTLGRVSGWQEVPCLGVAHTCLTWGKVIDIPKPPLIP